MSDDRKTWLFCGIALTLAAVALLGAWSSASDCRKAGGVPVRGMFGVECMQQCPKGGSDA